MWFFKNLYYLCKENPFIENTVFDFGNRANIHIPQKAILVSFELQDI